MDHHGPASFRRRIIIVVGKAETRATLEDDFHHFHVILHYDDVVRSVAAETLRYPWTSCARAADELQMIVGMTLSPEPLAIHAHADAAEQCTHMFDLAGLAIATAAKGVRERRFLATVARRDEAGIVNAVVERDGEPVLAWQVRNKLIEAPAPYHGQAIGRGFAKWVVGERPREEAETALILRRAVQVASGGNVDVDKLEKPLFPLPCYTLSPVRMDEARRMRGTRKRFEGPDAAVFTDEEQWLHDMR